ncbi:MAG TPA: ParB/RepB/Spo0J family partition protein [Mollicutes bacterium]|nr:ParB/RepB/Spo0J family partition protein [Mollicutes bacterium]
MDTKQIIEMISIENIIPNRFQPRLTFDEDGLNELSASIKEHGIIQPLVLRKLGDKYEIIAGERRYKAATMAGFTEVPAIISNLNDNESAEVALIENVQRKNLTSIEEAKSYKKILDKNYISQEDLAKRLGISQSTIANKLRLLNLTNEVQEALLNEKISERHARSLLQIENQEEQVKMLNRVITERLTVRKLDLAIKEMVPDVFNTSVNKTEVFDDNVNLDALNIEENKQEENLKTDETQDVNQAIPVNIFNQTPEVTQDENKPSELEIFDEITDEQETVDEQKEVAPIVQSEEPKEEIDQINENEETESEIKEPEVEKEKTSPLEIDVEAIKENAEDIIPKESKNIFDNISKNVYNSLEDEAANLSLDGSKEVEEEIDEKELDVPDFTPSAPIIIKKEEDEERIKPNNLPTAIQAFHKLEEDIKKVGYKITSEEFDFEDLYQIIIKIEKDNK